MTPIAQEIKLKYQFSLLSNSITSVLIDNDQVIIDDSSVIDTEGTIDPDAREFDLDDEEEYF
jgi:hypothetical protein